jgi:hypothetical protein
VQQIECLSFSCPLDYRIDTDHKGLHHPAQPEAKQYHVWYTCSEKESLRVKQKYAKCARGFRTAVEMRTTTRGYHQDILLDDMRCCRAQRPAKATVDRRRDPAPPSKEHSSAQNTTCLLASIMNSAPPIHNHWSIVQKAPTCQGQ